MMNRGTAYTNANAVRTLKNQMITTFNFMINTNSIGIIFVVANQHLAVNVYGAATSSK